MLAEIEGSPFSGLIMDSASTEEMDLDFQAQAPIARFFLGEARGPNWSVSSSAGPAGRLATRSGIGEAFRQGPRRDQACLEAGVCSLGF